MPDANETPGGIVVPIENTASRDELFNNRTLPEKSVAAADTVLISEPEKGVSPVIVTETAKTVSPVILPEAMKAVSPEVLLEPVKIELPKESPVEEEEEEEKQQIEEGTFTPVTDKSHTPEIPCRPSSASPATIRANELKEVIPEEPAPVITPSRKIESPLKPVEKKVQRTPMSFRELTAEFDRILKPLMASYNVQPAVASQRADPMSVLTDCQHKILAVEPRNPANPPKTLKIHRQRTVIRPGYMYAEPVLHDIPCSTESLTPEGVENLLKIVEGMRPIAPRIDNFTHHPPSQHLRKPPYHVPRSPSFSSATTPTKVAPSTRFTHGSTCSSGRM